jgi:hypothetical protein
MTVAELIIRLQEMPQNASVVYTHDDLGDLDVNKVSIYTWTHDKSQQVELS